MQMLTRIPLFVQPSVRPGLNALAAFLAIENYSQHMREQIIDYVAREGTIGGLVDRGWLEASDEELAEQVYCDALPMTPGVSSAWNDPGVWTDLDSYEDALQRALADTQEGLPPVSGGAPIEEHTPGPWNVQAPFSGMPSRWLVVSNDGVVCDVGLDCGRQPADARLIAVAPEAIEVCRELVVWLDQWGQSPLPVNPTQIKSTYEKAKAVIAKATIPPLSGGAPEDWPRKHTPEDRAAFACEVQAWFRHHRGE